MKTFTATHLNKHAQEVFAAAKEDGGVNIKHDRYKGGFIIGPVSVIRQNNWTPIDPDLWPAVGDIVTGTDGNRYQCIAKTGDKDGE